MNEMGFKVAVTFAVLVVGTLFLVGAFVFFSWIGLVAGLIVNASALGALGRILRRRDARRHSDSDDSARPRQVGALG